MEREESQVRRGKKNVSVLRRFVRAAAEQIALCAVVAVSVLALFCEPSDATAAFGLLSFFFLNVSLHFAFD